MFFCLAVLHKFPVPFKYISIHILDTTASIPNHLKMLHQHTTEDNNLLRKCSQDSTQLYLEETITAHKYHRCVY